MAGLPETPLWEPSIYQIEADDFASGGPSGHPNTSMRQLANRTAYLRQRLAAMTQTVVMHDDEGVAHHMVWVPRFRLAQGALGTGLPSRELRMGGFLVDKYPCVALDYVGGAVKALSAPMRKPWGTLTLPEATAAAQARKFDGRSARLMTLREWGHLDWLIRAIGHDLRGNLDDGRDPRDTDVWESFGEPGQGRVYAGSGPVSWFHNEHYDGIADLLGNVQHMLGESGFWYATRFYCNAGCLQVVRPATLVNAIDAAEVSFEIQDPAGMYFPKAGFNQWPATAGLLLLHDGSGATEFVIYGTLVINPYMPWRATVTDCVRGRFGFGADPWNVGAACGLVRYHHLVPGSYIIESVEGLANEAGPSTVDWGYGRFEFGTRDALPAINDVLCCYNEDLLVQGVSGQRLTVARGHNGTTIASHPAGRHLVKYSTTLNRSAQGQQTGYATGVVRTHADLEELRLPAVTQTGMPASLVPERVAFNLRWEGGYQAFKRGGSIATPGGMLSFTSPHVDAGTWYSVGFRCVLPLTDHQWGGAT